MVDFVGRHREQVEKYILLQIDSTLGDIFTEGESVTEWHREQLKELVELYDVETVQKVARNWYKDFGEDELLEGEEELMKELVELDVREYLQPNE